MGLAAAHFHALTMLLLDIFGAKSRNVCSGSCVRVHVSSIADSALVPAQVPSPTLAMASSVQISAKGFP